MKRIFRATLGLSIVASLLSPLQASAVSSNPVPDCSAGSTCTITFAYTGDYYAWTVPSGITSITVDAYGAEGGKSNYLTNSAVPGKGGRVQATLSATPGEVLYLYVGGAGSSVASTSSNTASAGWNGGGRGGFGNGSGYWGGGGGGATDIRTSVGSLASRVLVAGGGGGTACNSCIENGGAGGGLTGASGANTPSGDTGPSGGGTQSAGGRGSTYSGWGPGQSGALGVGGNAQATDSNASTSYMSGGGGGGGGYYGGGGGSWVGGGGGSSYTSGRASSVTHTQGARSGNGAVSITYLNAPTPTSFTTTESSRTKTTSSISYSITFSQNVNSVANGDFSNAGTATGCVFSISGASGSSFTLTVSSCGEGTLIPQVIANSVYGTVTASNGPAANALTTTPITIDRTAPTISSVAAPSNSTYIPGNTPTFTVNFSESVTVTGTPRLVLTVGSSAEYANFLSFSDSKTALFRYTVGTDPVEFDTDGISINTTLDLNGGAIADLATNAISDGTFTAPTLTSVLVAQPAAAPTIDSITATNGQLAIYFTAGAARGSTTTSYQYSSNNGAWTARPTGTTASPITLTGLTNGTGYTIRLRAVTNAGNSETSTAMTETPTAISVTGDSTLILTYGNSGSTGSYSATGGTGTYTWSLGSSISGITLSGTTVTAANTLAAGTYSQTVRATDGNSQVGTKTLTITINKASSSISIALPNGATNAALGGAVTITATVPRAGSVNFKLDGTTISGCGSASAASTTATCTWTPGSMGSVSLTAIFTPTDSTNYESATSTSLSITVVTGESSVTLQLTGGVTQAPKGQAINIVATVDQAGKISFYVDGRKIPGCFNKNASVGNVTCSWKPAVQKPVLIKATLDPTNSVYNNSTSTLKVQVTRRTGLR